MDNNSIELIEKYYESECSQSEIQNFERKYKEDAGFRNLANQHRDAIEAIKINGRQSLKKMLKEEHKRLYSPKVSWVRPLLAAASMIGLVATAYHFMVPSKSYTAKMILSELKPTPALNQLVQTVRSGGEPQSALKSFFIAYDDKDKNYKEAARQYYNIPLSERSATTEFFRANSLLFADSLSEAKPIFEQLANKTDFNYSVQSNYYLAVILLKENKLEEAIPYLKKVVQPKPNQLTKNVSNLLLKIDK